MYYIFTVINKSEDSTATTMAVETISAPLSEEVITSETPKIPNITSSSVLLVKPPPDIRAVVDRTALFVSKNGRVSS